MKYFFNYNNKNIKNLFVIMIYILLSLILTYPLISNIFTHIPGTDGDSFIFLWDQWWVKYSLLDLNQNPYFTEFIAYPFNTNLVFHTLTLFNSLVSVPLQVLFSSILTFNIIFIVSLSVAAYSMYLLVNYIFKNSYVALISGVIFVFNAYIYEKMLGHFNYTTIYFIPLFILFFIKIFDKDNVKNTIIAGIILALSFYNDFYYSIGLLVFAAIIIVWEFLKNKKMFFKKIKNLALCFFTWLIISAPLLYSSIKASLSNIYLAVKLNQINLYTPDIRSFIIPSKYHTVYGDNFVNYYHSLSFHGSIVYISFTLLFLAVIGYFYGRRKDAFTSSRFWLLAAIIFLFLTLGPFLYYDGYIFNFDGVMYTVPLPYLLFYLLPFVNGILVPPRFIIFVIFCLILLSVPFLVKIFSKLKNRLMKIFITFLIIGLFIFENLSIPIQISNAQIPGFYYELRDEENSYTILELPFALSTSFYTLGSIPVSSKLEYYQSVHNKKIINGWISRVPDEYYNFYSKIVGLDYLINPQISLDDEMIFNIKDGVKSNFSNLNIKYIIIHPEYYNHSQLRNTVEFLNVIYDTKPELINNMLIYQIK